MDEHAYAVIMAGGEGSRLWPLSRQSRPKQMLRLGSERTLFQLAVDRIADIFPPERILVVTVAEQAAGLKSQCPEIPGENYLLEPMPRGTASVVGLAAVVLRQRDPQAVMAILAADHLIQNVIVFRELLQQGSQLARDGYLVTLGIRPTYAATGYGYIQRGEQIPRLPFLAYQVQRFQEKPNLETARDFVARGDHDWNAGMFLWDVERIWQELEHWMPDLAQKLAEIAAAWATTQRAETLARIWPTITPQTIDYGIMEHAERVVVLPAVDLGWNDVGSWESLFEVFSAGDDGNIVLDAEHYGLDTHNTLVVSDGTQRLIVTLGVNDMIVVDTEDAVLVCSRANAQRIREVVRHLKEQEAVRRRL